MQYVQARLGYGKAQYNTANTECSKPTHLKAYKKLDNKATAYKLFTDHGQEENSTTYMVHCCQPKIMLTTGS